MLCLIPRGCLELLSGSEALNIENCRKHIEIRDGEGNCGSAFKRISDEKCIRQIGLFRHCDRASCICKGCSDETTGVAYPRQTPSRVWRLIVSLPSCRPRGKQNNSDTPTLSFFHNNFLTTTVSTKVLTTKL